MGKIDTKRKQAVNLHEAFKAWQSSFERTRAAKDAPRVREGAESADLSRLPPMPRIEPQTPEGGTRGEARHAPPVLMTADAAPAPRPSAPPVPQARPARPPLSQLSRPAPPSLTGRPPVPAAPPGEEPSRLDLGGEARPQPQPPPRPPLSSPSDSRQARPAPGPRGDAAPPARPTFPPLSASLDPWRPRRPAPPGGSGPDPDGEPPGANPPSALSGIPGALGGPRRPPLGSQLGGPTLPPLGGVQSQGQGQGQGQVQGGTQSTKGMEDKLGEIKDLLAKMLGGQEGHGPTALSSLAQGQGQGVQRRPAFGGQGQGFGGHQGRKRSAEDEDGIKWSRRAGAFAGAFTKALVESA